MYKDTIAVSKDELRIYAVPVKDNKLSFEEWKEKKNNDNSKKDTRKNTVSNGG